MVSVYQKVNNTTSLSVGMMNVSHKTFSSLVFYLFLSLEEWEGSRNSELDSAPKSVTRFQQDFPEEIRWL